MFDWQLGGSFAYVFTHGVFEADTYVPYFWNSAFTYFELIHSILKVQLFFYQGLTLEFTTIIF